MRIPYQDVKIIGGVAHVPLRGKRGAGLCAMVDEADLVTVIKRSWCLSSDGYAMNTEYVKDGDTKTRSIRMHRLILPWAPQVDHRNHDKLDNTRDNLRVSDARTNKYNSGLRNTNRSGYKGVSWHKATGKWKAAITSNFKPIHLGVFSERTDAAKAYDEAARKHYGEFAVLNFALPGERGLDGAIRE